MTDFKKMGGLNKEIELPKCNRYYGDTEDDSEDTEDENNEITDRSNVCVQWEKDENCSFGKNCLFNHKLNSIENIKDENIPSTETRIFNQAFEVILNEIESISNEQKGTQKSYKIMAHVLRLLTFGFTGAISLFLVDIPFPFLFPFPFPNVVSKNGLMGMLGALQIGSFYILNHINRVGFICDRTSEVIVLIEHELEMSSHRSPSNEYFLKVIQVITSKITDIEDFIGKNANLLEHLSEISLVPR